MAPRGHGGNAGLACGRARAGQDAWGGPAATQEKGNACLRPTQSTPSPPGRPWGRWGSGRTAKGQGAARLQALTRSGQHSVSGRSASPDLRKQEPLSLEPVLKEKRLAARPSSHPLPPTEGGLNSASQVPQPQVSELPAKLPRGQIALGMIKLRLRCRPGVGRAGHLCGRTGQGALLRLGFSWSCSNLRGSRNHPGAEE